MNNKCSFSISYSEGSSISGVYINEIVRFGENYKEQIGTFVPIGCTTDENHLFYTQDANGIMGLANNERNFVEILYKFGAIKKNIFSLCLAQLGGIFNIGEIKYTLGEPIDVIGGAVLKTADGDIEVNNTIEARLDRFKSILRSEVAEILFK